MTGPADRPDDDPVHPAAAPRWVKVFGVVAGILVLLFVALHLAGLRPGGHGLHSGHVGPAGTVAGS